MIFVSNTPRTEGRTKHWRAYSDTPGELEEVLQSKGISVARIVNRGEPGEYAILTTGQRNTIPGMKGATSRDLAKLIRRKQRAAAVSAPEQEPEQEQEQEQEQEPQASTEGRFGWEPGHRWPTDSEE